MHRAYVAVLYELSATRLLRPFWPTHGHYCQFPEGQAGATVHVRTGYLEIADLLAHHVSYLRETGALASAWRLYFAAHLAGAETTTLALEPSSSLPAAALEQDLRAIATDLSAGVRQIARSRERLSRREGRAATSDVEDESGEPPDLSWREREVLEHFLSGLGVESIAGRLFISPHTVRNHLKRLYQKLGVTSQRELRELFAGG